VNGVKRASVPNKKLVLRQLPEPFQVFLVHFHQIKNAMQRRVAGCRNPGSITPETRAFAWRYVVKNKMLDFAPGSQARRRS